MDKYHADFLLSLISDEGFERESRRRERKKAGIQYLPRWLYEAKEDLIQDLRTAELEGNTKAAKALLQKLQLLLIEQRGYYDGR